MTRIKNQHTYSLKNCRGGTVVDLSGHDNYTVFGFCPHDGSNQAWIFQQDGDKDGWFIKSSCSGKYLGIEGNPQNGTAVVAVSDPFKWDLKDSDIKSAQGIRILVHGTKFSLDLSDYGNSANGTKIQLWGSWPGANQIWAFTERISIEDHHAYSLRNCQEGTAIDLSGSDNHSINGCRPHDGYSQAWIFQEDDDQDGWFIKSPRTGKYLGIESNAGNGTRVVAVSSPFKWDIRESDVDSTKGVRILAYGTNFSLDLDYGNSADCRKVHLWESFSGTNQIWALMERISVEDQHTYSLKNCQGGTAVNLSGDDNRTIIGFCPHDGSNQAWIFQQDGENGWFIKSSHSGEYLGIKGNAGNGAMVVAVPSPFRWDVKDSEVQSAKGIRILAYGTNFSLDLDWGNSANHTKIHLWGSVYKANQIWALTERVFEDQHTYSPRNHQGGTEHQDVDSKILSITTTMREAFIMGDLSTAEKLLTQETEADARNHISYANRSLVMARKVDWDRALQNAVKSLSIQPSLIGYIAKGNALCGKQHVRDARTAFDLTFTFVNGDQRTTLLLFLIKAIALFNANEHEEAMMRVKELVAGSSVDPVACLVVEAYLQIQLGIIALDGKFYNEAVEAFTAAVKAGNSFADLPIHTMYEEFAVFFGWDLESLWQSANRQLCIALFRAGKYGKGLELYLSMMEASDEATKASTRAWFADFK